jgi:hypothetical protein
MCAIALSWIKTWGSTARFIQAPYNACVARFSLDRRWTLLLLAVLFGLLALGPFLHAHLGFSKVTGFHVAGFDGPVTRSSAQVPLASSQASQVELSDAESPAVGVSASLVRFSHDIPCPDGISLQAVVAIVLITPVLRGFARPTRYLASRPSRHRPGLPPPALAPPVLGR